MDPRAVFFLALVAGALGMIAAGLADGMARTLGIAVFVGASAVVMWSRIRISRLGGSAPDLAGWRWWRGWNDMDERHTRRDDSGPSQP